jgi:hypothetical protein
MMFEHNFIKLLNIIILSGVRLSPLGTVATTGLLYQPRFVNDDDCGAVGGMRIGRGIRSRRRNPAPAPLCPPEIPHDLSRALTRAAAVVFRRLITLLIHMPVFNRPLRFMAHICNRMLEK